MSTKTTFKRIALVTVAALGFGLLSVVPSNATASAVDFAVSGPTASQLTGETATATSVVATLSYQASAATDSMTVTASLFSAKNPDGTNMTSGVAQPNMDLSDTATAQVNNAGLAARVLKAADAGTAIANDTAANVVPTAAGGVVVKLRVFLNAPTKAGTYVVRLTPTLPANSTAGSLQSAAAQTVTITVTAAPADDLVAATATSILNAGETASATADATVTAARTASTTVAAATIKVTLANKAGLAANESFTAVIAGPGFLGSGANTGAGSPVVISGPDARARVITVQNGHVVQVFPDGSSGVATITLASMAGVTLATETITFFGAAATVVTTVSKAVIGGTSEVADVLSVVVKDSAGVNVSNLANSLAVVSSDTTKIASDYTTASTYSATTGAYLLAVTPVAAGTANLTVTTKASSTDTGIDATAVSVRVGSSTPASVAVTTDKNSYAPGEKATITISLKDSTGLDLAAGNYASIFAAGGIAANYTLGGGSDTTTATYVNGYTAGAATYTVYMPVTEGDVKFSWTTGSVAATSGAGLATANQAVAGSVTVSVSSPSTAAATDAANEATDAANAATDAALAAAEAADAATTAAQEASDAVAALSESVTKLIAGLQAQIKSLAAVVAKIAKKVKA